MNQPPWAVRAGPLPCGDSPLPLRARVDKRTLLHKQFIEIRSRHEDEIIDGNFAKPNAIGRTCLAGQPTPIDLAPRSRWQESWKRASDFTSNGGRSAQVPRQFPYRSSTVCEQVGRDADLGDPEDKHRRQPDRGELTSNPGQQPWSAPSKEPAINSNGPSRHLHPLISADAKHVIVKQVSTIELRAWPLCGYERAWSN